MAFARPTHLAVLQPQRLELGAFDARSGQVTRYASRALPPGLLARAPGLDAGHVVLGDPERLAAELAACAREVGAKRVRLALDGPLVRTLVLPVNFVPARDELAMAVRSEIERYRVFADQPAAVDFATVGLTLDRLTLLFGALRLADLVALQAVFEAADLDLLAVEPYAVALVRGLARDFEPAYDVTGEPCGVAALAPHELAVVTWAQGRPTGWRSVAVDAAELARQDPGARTDLAEELKRSAMDAGGQRWLAYGLPAGLERSLAMHPAADVAVRDPAPAGGPGDALLGLAAGNAEAMPPALDLIPRAPVVPRSFSNAQLAGVGVFSAILAALVGFSVVLEGRARVLGAQLDGVRSQEQTLQLLAAARARHGDVPGGAAARLAHGAAVARVFNGLREVTPADTWITQAKIDAAGALSVSGLALSASSPMAFAEALGRMPGVEHVGLPDLHREQLLGKRVHRFTITGTLAGGAKP